MNRTFLALAAGLSCIAVASLAPAAPLSVRDSFRIGNSGTIFCSAQSTATDKALVDMFDAGYSITCRDAALPVGKLYKLRDGGNVTSRLAALRAADVTCGAPQAGNVPGLGAVQIVECRRKDADVGYRAYQLRKGRILYAAEGLTGYDTVLQLGLRSIVADEPAKGDISIATTGVGDPAAFARVQAGTLDPAKALSEAYRRNNAGSYAEAAEFFAAVSNSGDAPLSRAEGLANEALQKSNLGRYAQADSLFARAAEQVGADPIVARRLRNYRAIHDLNQGNSKGALAELDKPLPKAVLDREARDKGTLEIDSVIAKRLNADSRIGQQLSAQSDELLPAEKAEILDGQALQLRGTALRLTGDPAGASNALRRADAALEAVRGGKVASILWMRAQIYGDLAAIAEEGRNNAEADRLYRQGVALLDVNYPGSAALLNAKARLAGYLARTGQSATAEAMFRDIVHSQPDTTNLPPSFAHVLRPYVDLLLRKNDHAATEEIFAASQLMVRPGLAQTQAVLARELSGGTDEAARLFRQSVTLSRQIERARVELARLGDLPKPTPEEIVRTRTLRATLDLSQKEQLTTQSALGSFPRYRAVSSDIIPIAEFEKVLRPGEAYYRMTIVGDHVYAMLVSPASARAVKLGVTAKQLDQQVSALRDTISVVENGQRQTYPFDVAMAHQLFGELFGPFAADIAATKHLIFEPDGAMLRLPANLLVMDQGSVDLIQKRTAEGGDAAAYDFRGVSWLGRDRDISTSVSPRSFAQLRAAPPSAGSREYLGFGDNALPSAAAQGLVPAAVDRDCILPMSSWARPISAHELEVAGNILRPFNPGGVTIVTKDNFTDTGIESRGDLDQYRILHFATHGVVTSRAAKCPAQPALLTSFGGNGSDGLLTFKEIFDLRLDADLVILSACDTAGKASAAATQQAGLATGGDVALDGLVRAFVGAGARLVIASHWPVPDDFSATHRLITGLFSVPAGTPTVSALRKSQRQLMDDANTSHPFYWSAFAVVGDGEIPVIRAKQVIAAK
ncbi:MAG: CHAT domain-containing protein [Pseudomonadota bacterium]